MLLSGCCAVLTSSYVLFHPLKCMDTSPLRAMSVTTASFQDRTAISSCTSHISPGIRDWCNRTRQAKKNRGKRRTREKEIRE